MRDTPTKSSADRPQDTLEMVIAWLEAVHEHRINGKAWGDVVVTLSYKDGAIQHVDLSEQNKKKIF